jgi:hypothetical protein
MTISITIPSGNERAALAALAFFQALTDETAEVTEPPAPPPANPEPEPKEETDYRLDESGEFVPADQATPPKAPAPGPDQDSLGGASDNAVELDYKGLPWDERIHSSNKAKNADGTWRYKRGVDRDTLVPQVESELRAVLEPELPLDPDATEVFSSAPPPPPQTVSHAFSEPQPSETIEAPDTPADFQAFLASIAYLRKERGVTVEAILSACKSASDGVESINILSERPELIPVVWAELTA